MPLGDTYNSNEKKNYSPSLNSGYRFSNPDSTIDKTSLTFAFWNKLLKVSIAPKKETENGEIAFDHENAGSVYLSHTKSSVKSFIRLAVGEGIEKEVVDFAAEVAAQAGLNK